MKGTSSSNEPLYPQFNKQNKTLSIAALGITNPSDSIKLKQWLRYH